MTAARFPTLQLEAAFTEGGALIFDDATLGKFNTGLFGPDLVWTDLTDGGTIPLLSFNVQRGRTGPFQRFNTGTASFVLDNFRLPFDPDNAFNFGTVVAGVPIGPMTPIRFTATWGAFRYTVFQGYADGWYPTYTPGDNGLSTVELRVSDAFKLFSYFMPAEPALSQGAGESVDARLARVLDWCGWSATDRNLDTSDYVLQATTLAQSALDEMQTAADAELGQLFMSAANQVTFQNRQHRLLQPLTYRFSDQVVSVPGGAPVYSDVARVVGDDILINEVQAQIVGGTLQTVTNPASIAKFSGPLNDIARTFNSTSLALTTDGAALNWASFVLNVLSSDEATNHVSQIAFSPLGDPDNLWFPALASEISDVISVTVNPGEANFGTFPQPVFYSCIESMQHQGDHQSWSTSFGLSPAPWYANGWFVFDNPDLGVFDQSAFA